MGFFGNLTQGIAGNYSEVSVEKLTEQYGMYLIEDETIKTGFTLIRDTVIFTDKRIIEFDKQGTTGQKARVTSIWLDSVIGVSAETAGFGIDDSDIIIEYISSPYFRASGGVNVEKKTFEFPKKYDVQGLYAWLCTVACKNHEYINR